MVFFLKDARNTLEKGLPGIYAILEKKSAMGIIGAIAVAVALLGVGALLIVKGDKKKN